MIETNYRCDDCGKFRKPDANKIGMGDFVSFPVTTKTSRNNFRITAKEGEVVSIKDKALQVKVKRGGIYWVSRDEVTPKGAPNPLTYFMLGVCECAAANTPTKHPV
ncbi:hypothetical protein JOS77_27210 [Chromobacterium haemolyticum]|nr:hypothetical protein JOS77_27210 [Chromobacterium haemolyticum]